MTESNEEGPTLGAEVRALEEIVRRLESDDADLDEALRLFEEGVQRLRRARGRLAQAEQAVQVVLEQADGTLRTSDADL
ncbi:MAG: exodeoxyribonuclease VII small subunit [Gemmatimonadales bacterium]|jgi:exodeoxyribonuclease VII small subunit|nr:exodeoxyribonuclease VII small subunit [Gemmatimonadales bacterium]